MTWSLPLLGARRPQLDADELLALPRAAHEPRIACVEGWGMTKS